MQYGCQGVPRLLVCVSALVCLVIIFGAACSSCQVTRTSGAEPKSAELAQIKGTPPTASQAVLLVCPPTHLSPLRASTPGTERHHQVTLSWIAAPSSPRPGGDVVGYCIYRSTTQYAAKQDPLCPVCERVNLAPVKDVSCIDDLVDDHTTYYYVVTAINGGDNISSPSNEATAPVGNQPNSVPRSSPLPSFCRGTSSAR